MEESWTFRKNTLLGLRDKFIPKIKTSGNPNWKDKNSFPLNKEARDAIKEKNTTFRRWMSSANDEAARLSYRKASRKTKKMIRKAKKDFEKTIADRSKLNPNAFWSHARRKIKTKSSIAPLLADVKDNKSLKFSDKE